MRPERSPWSSATESRSSSSGTAAARLRRAPGRSVEPGETFEEAAVRELREESTLRARVDHQLLAGEHHGREARYFVMTDVEGSPTLSGPELEAHAPDNSFELLWAGAEDLSALGLHPAHLCDDLPRLLSL